MLPIFAKKLKPTRPNRIAHHRARGGLSAECAGIRRASALVPVVADGFDRAAFLGLLALGFLLGAAGLFLKRRSSRHPHRA